MADYAVHRYAFDAKVQKVENLDVHALTVQIAAGVHYTRRVDGHSSNGFMARGESWIRPAGTYGISKWDRRNDVFVLWIPPQVWNRILSGQARDYHVPTPQFLRSTFIESAVWMLARDEETDRPYGDLLHGALLTAMVAEIAGEIDPAEREIKTDSLSGWRLRRVLAYINDNFARNISLLELAGVVDLSERYFCVAFKQSTGVTPHRYLLEKRVGKAQELISLHHDMTFTDIAATLGFKTAAHFSTAFKHVTGVSPTAYRSRI